MKNINMIQFDLSDEEREAIRQTADVMRAIMAFTKDDYEVYKQTEDANCLLIRLLRNDAFQ